MRWIFLFLIFTCQYAFSQAIEWKNIPTQTEASFRGLSVVDDNVAWVSGSKGTVGKTTNGGESWDFKQVKGFETLDFRSLYAFDRDTALIANAGFPARIFRTNDGGKSWIQVYSNPDSAAFFDGIDFWNGTEGIAFGDPIKGKMLLLRTHDGGRTWEELEENRRPVLEAGEASFAASGTTIRCLNNWEVVIATGGKISRFWVSMDTGQTWKASYTPVIQGKNSTGVFSFAFWDKKQGLLVGGDYLQDTLKKDHVFYSKDSGKTWLPPFGPTRGYRECVEYLNEKLAVAIGPGGSDYSPDGGLHWKPLSDEKGFHVVRKARKGKLVIAAGGKGRMAVLKY